MYKFKVGDRVVRHEDVYDQSSRLMHGVVSRRYDKYNPKYGNYPELYDVQWEYPVTKFSHGYLPHGLHQELNDNCPACYESLGSNHENCSTCFDFRDRVLRVGLIDNDL